MFDLIENILRRAAVGESVAVCTVAHTRGSTAQKAGAMMLVLQDGRTIGTLGGGCMEAEVRVRALQLVSARRDRLLTFKLDHDYGWDDGLVCGGVMEIAVQVVADVNSAAPWQAIRDLLASGQESPLSLRVPDEKGEAKSFDLVIRPAPVLIIAGAGHVGKALAELAAGAGFDVTVIDERPDFASTARIPGARCIVGEIEIELSRMAVHEQTYIVIVTRGHRHDGRALAAVIGKPVRYVGLIGSRRKILTILGDLRRQGVTAEQLARVHAPIGLEIGAITPGEIAVSIAAELIAVRRRGNPEGVGSMRLTAEQLARVKEEP